MLSRFSHEQRESTTRIAVDVTFLKMSRPPQLPAPVLGDHLRIDRVSEPNVGFYRYLYNAVGGDYCWWLRRIMPDAELQKMMFQPGWSLNVLYASGAPGGFYELEQRRDEINLSYFGLMPHMIGRGAGRSMLVAAVDDAWRRSPSAVRVNTCNADHPRALDLYRSVGFSPLRTIREIWDIPDTLGLPIPARLRI